MIAAKRTSAERKVANLQNFSKRIQTPVENSKLPYSPLFSRDLNFAKIFSAHFSSLKFCNRGEKLCLQGI